MAESRQPGNVQSVARAFGLLEVLGERGGQAGLSELAEATGLAMPTMHRLLRTLVQLGYVRQLPSRRYSLGPGLIRLGDRATRLLGTWARPALVELEEATRETTNLALLDGDRAVYVAQVPSHHQVRMFTEVGRRVFAHSTGVGKAMLAQLDDEDVVAILRRAGMPRYTDNTHTTEAGLLADLDEIRTRGYAVDEGEQEVGVRCYAVPVPGAPTPTAVSVSGPDTRVTLSAARWMLPALERAADELADALSSTEPDLAPH
ncbi:IclR family transcriptional regulator [Isoptericola sp. AK164]|uniref:IclR family transcriptional regulator n=1 Tax=Isoptericola sp. AK164 TaxID=3024246 RepID=UPI0024183CE3|nr:IclR family transcriptional regulator [Isoptericola sp. AK164]